MAARDSDLYAQLPRATLVIVSVGVPKAVDLAERDQAELYARLRPVLKAIELYLLAAAVQHTHDKRRVPARSIPGTRSARSRTGTGEEHPSDAAEA